MWHQRLLQRGQFSRTRKRGHVGITHQSPGLGKKTRPQNLSLWTRISSTSLQFSKAGSITTRERRPRAAAEGRAAQRPGTARRLRSACGADGLDAVTSLTHSLLLFVPPPQQDSRQEGTLPSPPAVECGCATYGMPSVALKSLLQAFS